MIYWRFLLFRSLMIFIPEDVRVLRGRLYLGQSFDVRNCLQCFTPSRIVDISVFRVRQSLSLSSRAGQLNDSLFFTIEKLFLGKFETET